MSAFGVKQTSKFKSVTSAFDPIPTSGNQPDLAWFLFMRVRTLNERANSIAALRFTANAGNQFRSRVEKWNTGRTVTRISSVNSKFFGKSLLPLSHCMNPVFAACGDRRPSGNRVGGPVDGCHK
jgi:hypothetical protein